MFVCGWPLLGSTSPPYDATLTCLGGVNTASSESAAGKPRRQFGLRAGCAAGATRMRWGAGEGISTQAYRSIAENVNKRKSGGSDAGSGVGGRRYEYDGGGGGQPWRRGAGHTGWQTSGIELDAECGGGSMHFAEMAASLGAPDAAANKRHRTEQLVSGLESLQLKTDPQTPLWLCPVYKEEEESTSFAAEHYLLPVSSGRYGADTTMWHSTTMHMNHNYMTDQVLAKLESESITLTARNGALVPYKPLLPPEDVVAVAATKHVRARLRGMLDHAESSNSTQRRRLAQLEAAGAALGAGEKGKRALKELCEQEGGRSSEPSLLSQGDAVMCSEAQGS